MAPQKEDGPADDHDPLSAGRPAPGRGAPQPRAGAAPASERPLRLTARGGVFIIALLSFAGTMASHVTGWPAITGGAFTAACVLTALLVRPGDLLSLSVSPPLAYFSAAAAAEVLLTLGSDGFARAVLVGLAARLADVAPWLFLGTALVLVISVVRGLPSRLREFSDELNGRAGPGGGDGDGTDTGTGTAR